MRGPGCSICAHADQPRIDAALTGGAALIPTAEAWGVSKSALGRHRSGCLGGVGGGRAARAPVARPPKPPKAEAATSEAITSASGLTRKLADTLDRLEAAADVAAGKGHAAALATISGQISRALELAGKLNGHFKDRPAGDLERPHFQITITVPPGLDNAPVAQRHTSLPADSIPEIYIPKISIPRIDRPVGET